MASAVVFPPAAAWSLDVEVEVDEDVMVGSIEDCGGWAEVAVCASDNCAEVCLLGGIVDMAAGRGCGQGGRCSSRCMESRPGQRVMQQRSGNNGFLVARFLISEIFGESFDELID